MKVLITGAGGQLARELVATAPAGVELRSVSRSECDITSLPVVERVVTSLGPDVVINAAAYTRVDDAEDSSESAFLVNASGAENVAKGAELIGARLIHISTDYVFDGRGPTPYSPDAQTNPLNVYGASKLEGEKLTLAAAPNAAIVRAGWLYSATGRNFLVSVLTALRAGRSLSVVRDQEGSPTRAHEFARAIWKMTNQDLQGIYHWANGGSVSWYGFAREIAQIAQQLGLLSEEPEIRSVTTREYASRAKRPAYSVLDPTKLAAALQISPSSWQQALATEMRRGHAVAPQAGLS